jgi:hypothetical protein
MDSPTLQLVYLCITMIALYFSFERNKGFDLGSFLVALLFSPIYIVYYLATQNKRM